MGSRIAIRVTPRSAKPGIGDWKRDPAGRPFLDIRVAAAPTDGDANAEVVKVVAKALGLAKTSVRIVSGHAARLKLLAVPLSDEEVKSRLPG
jgi:uncharacterized protein